VIVDRSRFGGISDRVWVFLWEICNSEVSYLGPKPCQLRYYVLSVTTLLRVFSAGVANGEYSQKG
jgi:hypothetical protein